VSESIEQYEKYPHTNYDRKKEEGDPYEEAEKKRK
jgi:hypothetical protein